MVEFKGCYASKSDRWMISWRISTSNQPGDDGWTKLLWTIYEWLLGRENVENKPLFTPHHRKQRHGLMPAPSDRSYAFSSCCHVPAQHGICTLITRSNACSYSREIRKARLSTALHSALMCRLTKFRRKHVIAGGR
jgi:hypothetical protein